MNLDQNRMHGSHDMVGRDFDLAEIESALNRGESGSPHIVELVGPAGIGKTTLLKRTLSDSAVRGSRIISGRGTEFEVDLPFGLAADAFGQLLDNLDDKTIAHVGPERLQVVAAILAPGALAKSTSVAEPTRRVGRVERLDTYRTVRTVIEALAADQPVVIAFDDVHWADQGSVELLSYLLSRLPSGPVVLVFAYRPTRLPVTLAAALETVRREDACTRIDLEPLTPGAARELVGTAMDSSTLDSIYSESGGNPFYFKQLAKTIDLPRRGRLSGSEVPQGVVISIERELAFLNQRARWLLQGATMVGESFDLGTAAVAGGLDPADDTLQLLDEILSLDLAIASAETPRFLFRHPIVRRAVYESSPLGWRMEAHARLADFLRERGAPVAIVAHHVMCSSSVGDEDAIEFLTDAGRSTLTQAPASAGEFFATALDLLRETTDPEYEQRKLDLLISKAMALGMAGNFVDSRTALRRVLELVPIGNDPLRIQASVFAAMLENLLVNHKESERILLDALSNLPNRHSKESADLRIELAFSHLFQGNFDETTRQGEEVLATGQSEPVVIASAYSALAASASSLGKHNEAESYLDLCVKNFNLASDAQLAAHMDVCCWLGSTELALGRPADSLRHVERGLGILRATENSRLIESLLFLKGRALYWCGDVEAASEAAYAAYEASVVSPTVLMQPWVIGLCCAIAMSRGNIVEAVKWGERGLSVDQNGPIMNGYSTTCLAEVLLATGDPDRALKILRDHIDRVGLPRIPLHQSLFRQALFGALLASGAIDEAMTVVEETELELQRRGHRLEVAIARRMRARALLEKDCAAAAIDPARSAIDAASTVNALIEVAVSRTLLGQLLSSVGQRDCAIEQLELAERDLSKAGAKRERNEAARLLRSLGRRAPTISDNTSPVGVGSFSAREREVAELVAADRTNRQIGKALFISEKTVERHLSRIFEKLQVKSRVSVAREMERFKLQLAAPETAINRAGSSRPMETQ